MENRINIAELLKDCPTGMELNCVLYENVTLEYVVQSSSLPICIRIQNKGTMFLSKYGQLHDQNCCKCIIFPKGKTTWEGFQRPFKDGDIVVCGESRIDEYVSIFKTDKAIDTFYYHAMLTLYTPKLRFKTEDWALSVNIRLATEEEKQKLFDAIKENGYKWNAETKTLEKLPKFKVRDRIKGKYTNNIHTISGITSRGYELTNGQTFTFNAEDCYELVPNKFDISNLKPYQEMLFRQNEDCTWFSSFFGFYDKNAKTFPYICCNGFAFKYCIPFEGNEHLLGTTDDCEEYYKTWE